MRRSPISMTPSPLLLTSLQSPLDDPNVLNSSHWMTSPEQGLGEPEETVAERRTW